jgi:hypothetical protein
MAENIENNVSKATLVAPQDPSFLQYRLNTDPIIQQVEISLSGKLTQYLTNSQTGEIVETSVEISSPKVNKEGFASIINYLRVHINNQTVQGNLDDDRFRDFIASVREDFAMILMINMYKWDIKDSDYQYICDSIADVIKLFLSRTLDNKERESYSMMKQETQTQRTQKGWGLQ